MSAQRSALRACLASLVLLLAACQSPPPALLPVGASLPPLLLEGLDGGTLASADWRGRTVVLNLWATWCVPCREEMPALERLSRGLDPAHYRVIGVSLDTDRNLVREFALRYGVTFALAIDPDGQSLKALRSRVLPDTLLIAPDGRLAGRVQGGAAWDSDEMRGRVLAASGEAEAVAATGTGDGPRP